MHRVYLVLMVLILAGCATTGPEYDAAHYSQFPTPEEAVNNEFGNGTYVLWGGIIVSSVNKNNETELEILGYPLKSSQKPETSADPVGRFIAKTEYFLEPLDYAQGRQVTVTGSIQSIQEGTVGASEYSFPVVAIDNIHLWTKSENGFWQNISIGVGVGFQF